MLRRIELYRDGIVVFTYSEALLDDAVALISDALGARARLAEREVRPIPLAPNTASGFRLAA